jgi:hypothetical protein
MCFGIDEEYADQLGYRYHACRLANGHVGMHEPSRGCDDPDRIVWLSEADARVRIEPVMYELVTSSPWMGLERGPYAK